MAIANLPDDLFTEIQTTFRRTPVVLVGSGFSCGYELPGMGALGQHLADVVHASLSSAEAKAVWAQTADSCRANLESGLNTIPHGVVGRDEIVASVRYETAKLIIEKTAAAELKILDNSISVRHAPSRLLSRLFDGAPQNAEAIHVITTNYDTLLELFCDLAGLPLDTGFTGFRRRKPRPHPIFQTQYSRVWAAEKRQVQQNHRICKTVRLYKPHGSISWLTTDEGPMEVLNDVSVATRAIVVPGPSKYQDALVHTLFDAMRTEMNAVISDAQALMCIGFGFNDDHLQGAIKRRLAAGMPVIIIALDSTPNIKILLREHPHVIALFKSENGSVCHWNGREIQSSESLWQLDNFLKKFLE